MMRRRVKAPVSCQRLFHIGPSDEVLCVARVRTADGVPMLVERNYFLGHEYDFLESIDLTDCSLFALIKDRCDKVPELHEACTLEILGATAEMAPWLDVLVGEPLFKLAGDYFDSDGEPMFFGEQFIVGSRYLFTV